MSIENIKELRERTGAGLMDVKKALEASDNDIEKAIDWLRKNGISKAAKKSNRVAAEGSVFISRNDKKVVMIEINSETDFVASNDLFVSTSEKIVNLILNSKIELKNNNDALELKDESDQTINDLLVNLTATIGEKISLRRFVILEGKTSYYKHANNRIGVIISGTEIDDETMKDLAMHIAAMSPEYLSKDEIPAEKIEKENELAKIELAKTLEGKPENIQANIIKGKVDKILSENILLEQTFVKDSSKKVKDLLKKGKINSFVRYQVGEGIEKVVENFAEEVQKQIKNK